MQKSDNKTTGRKSAAKTTTKTTTKSSSVKAKKPASATPKKSSKKVLKKSDATEMLVQIAVKGLEEKKGKDIVIMNLKGVKNSVTDYFVIAHGDSRTQVMAMADSVEEEIFKALGIEPWHKEGLENGEWILLDYFDMVVHIFQYEKREFFGLERLWADAEIKKISH